MSWHINPQQHSLKRKLTPKCLRITSGILWLAKYVKWQQHKTSRARLQLFEVMHVYLAVFVSNESTSQEHTNTVPAGVVFPEEEEWTKCNTTPMRNTKQQPQRRMRMLYLFQPCHKLWSSRSLPWVSWSRFLGRHKEADYTKTGLSSSLTPCLYKNRWTKKVRRCSGSVPASNTKPFLLLLLLISWIETLFLQLYPIIDLNDLVYYKQTLLKSHETLTVI